MISRGIISISFILIFTYILNSNDNGFVRTNLTYNDLIIVDTIYIENPIIVKFQQFNSTNVMNVLIDKDSLNLLPYNLNANFYDFYIKNQGYLLLPYDKFSCFFGSGFYSIFTDDSPLKELGKRFDNYYTNPNYWKEIYRYYEKIKYLNWECGEIKYKKYLFILVNGKYFNHECFCNSNLLTHIDSLDNVYLKTVIPIPW